MHHIRNNVYGKHFVQLIVFLKSFAQMTNGGTRRPFRRFQRRRHRFRQLSPPSCEKLPVQKCLAQLTLAVFHLLASPLSHVPNFVVIVTVSRQHIVHAAL